MNFARALLLSGFMALSAGPVLAATMRELNSAELRKVAQSGDLISLKRVVEAVAKSTGGDPIEARAFALDGVFYRIVLKKANGALISVIIDARTGEQVAKGSAAGRQVSAAAQASGKDKAAKGKSQTAGSNGNGKSGGNGNSGGNGGSGGNGNSGGGNSGGGGSGGGKGKN